LQALELKLEFYTGVFFFKEDKLLHTLGGKVWQTAGLAFFLDRRTSQAKQQPKELACGFEHTFSQDSCLFDVTPSGKSRCPDPSKNT